MNSLLSPNPEEREEAVRHLVRRLLSEASCPVTQVAKKLGRTRQLLDKQLADDGDSYLRLSDLGPLVAHIIPELLDELAAAVNRRVVPADRAGNVDAIVEAIGATLSTSGELAQTTMEALRDGRVDGPEALKIGRAASRVVAAVGGVEACVGAASVGSRR